MTEEAKGGAAEAGADSASWWIVSPEWRAPSELRFRSPEAVERTDELCLASLAAMRRLNATSRVILEFGSIDPRFYDVYERWQTCVAPLLAIPGSNGDSGCLADEIATDATVLRLMALEAGRLRDAMITTWRAANVFPDGRPLGIPGTAAWCSAPPVGAQNAQLNRVLVVAVSTYLEVLKTTPAVDQHRQHRHLPRKQAFFRRGIECVLNLHRPRRLRTIATWAAENLFALDDAQIRADVEREATVIRDLGVPRDFEVEAAGFRERLGLDAVKLSQMRNPGSKRRGWWANHDARQIADLCVSLNRGGREFFSRRNLAALEAIKREFERNKRGAKCAKSCTDASVSAQPGRT
jgi:hypothetical protein